MLFISRMSRATFINSTVVYNDYSNEYNIDARGNKDVDALIRACKSEDIETSEDVAYSEKEQADTTKNTSNNAAKYEHILPIPRKGKYTEVRRYIEERCKFDEEFRSFVATHSRVELCMRLTNEFGWDVDDHHLGVNINRNR